MPRSRSECPINTLWSGCVLLPRWESGKNPHREAYVIEMLYEPCLFTVLIPDDSTKATEIERKEKKKQKLMRII